MLQFYPQIKSLHVAMIVASGLLFALRGAGSLAGMLWPLSWAARGLSYVVDTTLLAAALVLASILPAGAFANGWLAMKIGLLVVYVALGYMALRPGRSRPARTGMYLLALLVYAWMVTIARAHHPLGAFHDLVRP